MKDTATRTALVISRNLVSRLFRYLQLQSKTGYGQGKGRRQLSLLLRMCRSDCFSCKEKLPNEMARERKVMEGEEEDS